MVSYSIADAKNRLPMLLSASERGERVTITRDGKAVAELRAVSDGKRRMTAASIEWLERQLADLPPPREDSVAPLEALRGGNGCL
ncbi:MAG TPA: type II toxin-antitoxin system prevent-host-death family antitoxin [Acetobacteraceae bacterium]|nr:type II toxin-antitoxin system prevent-host-death family antitoxin [Acetobacteraceae bacterium]